MGSHSGGLTRRQALKGGALALAAAGAAELSVVAGHSRRPASGPAARTAPARCVSLGANGVINPGSSQDYRNCRAFLRDTRTKWVRIWADWPSLQPEGALAPDAGSGAWRVAALDEQIAAANADGVRVVLTAYRFPGWANGSSSTFKLPADLASGSPWAKWIEFLLERYATSIAALEVVNEPNSQLAPLADVHEPVAQMFQTAQSVAAGHPEPPLLMGPATSDSASNSPHAVPHDTFTRRLLDELDRIGFEPGRGFAWAHHNYTDVEYDRDTGAATTRALLTGRWSGWPHADPANPTILISEGGARLTKIADVYGISDPAEVRATQADLIRRNWDRMVRKPWIAMLGQYLFYTDPNFDCGLCDVDGTRRPAYSAWSALERRS